jgi:hypothetical protein
LAACCVTGMALVVAALPILGGSIYSSYLRLLREDSSWQGRSLHKPLWYHGVPVPTSTYAPEWNHSFAGFAQLLVHGHAATLLYAGLSLGALGIVTLCSLRSSSIELPLAVAVVVGLLISPHTLIYDYTILLLPVGAALRYRVDRRGPLALVLLAGYVMVSLGYRFAFFIPLQLAVIAASMLVLWLAYLSLSRTASVVAHVGHRAEIDPAGRIEPVGEAVAG